MRGPDHPKRWVWIIPLLLLASSFLSSSLHPAHGFISGESASTVLGQPSFTSTVNPPDGLKIASNLAFDSSGDLWVADSGNNRVLEETGLGSAQGASVGVVLGQTTLTTGSANATQNTLYNPSGMAFDSSGNLWVTDTNNSRVLEFARPFTDGENASVVIGQPDFTSSSSGSSATGLSYPAAVTFDTSGDMWVVDAGNNRVLEYKPPFTSGMSATLALGQPNLVSSVNYTTQSGLSFPASARFDSSGNLWVADAENDRILEYKAPFSTGMSASLVLGQGSFTSSVAAATRGGLNLPESLAFDPSGNLWVADTFNDRVIEYTTPFSTGMNATLVLGQANFTSTTLATSRTGMEDPSEVAFDRSGNLWVADLYNNRILEFSPPFQSGAPAARVLGQADFSSNLLDGGAALQGPASVAVDSKGDLWAVDTNDNRVVEYRPPLSTGMNASLAIGQATLDLGSPGDGRAGLWAPYGVAFDASGDLWVSDTDNNRVMEFVPPFSTGMNATLVIGQANFTTYAAGFGQNGLNSPLGISFSSSGDLFVADAGNSRVLEFEPPFTSGMNASAVLGQAGFSSTPDPSPSDLQLPAGLAFDPSGNLWVTDVESNSVVEFAKPFSTGQTGTQMLAGSALSPTPSQSNLAGPFGIAFDSSGNLWLTDIGFNRVLEFDSPIVRGEAASAVLGQPGFTAGSPGTSQTTVSEPFGLAFGSSGTLWVADYGNNRVLGFPNSGFTTVSVSSSSPTSSTSTSSSTSASTTSSLRSSSATSSSTRSASSSVATASSSSTATTSSPVPEFPLGASSVFAVALFAATIASSWVRRPRRRPETS